jgi:hypothetical protein
MPAATCRHSKLIPYDGNDAWIERTLLQIRETLSAPEPPAMNGKCEFCVFAAKSVAT